MHDCWPPFWQLDDGTHALCNGPHDPANRAVPYWPNINGGCMRNREVLLMQVGVAVRLLAVVGR